MPRQKYWIHEYLKKRRKKKKKGLKTLGTNHTIHCKESLLAKLSPWASRAVSKQHNQNELAGPSLWRVCSSRDGTAACWGRGLAFSGLTKNIKILVRRPQKGRFGTEAEEESPTDGTATRQLTTRLGCPPDLCWLSPESSPTGTGKSKSDGVNRWLRIWCTLTHILHEPVSGPGISRRGIWPQSIQQSHGQYCTETSTGIHEVGKRLLPELNI